MIIISIDPQVEQSAGAFHWWTGGQTLKPCGVGMFETSRFIKNHAQIMWPMFSGVKQNSFTSALRIAIIEGQYVGVSKKGSLDLCKAANRMAGALIANGFEVFEASVWGSGAWQNEMFSIDGRPQKRDINKKLSVAAAKKTWTCIANSDEADAVMIGQWWWSKNKFKYLGGGGCINDNTAKL